MNARDALLQLCDGSNWGIDDESKDFFRGYSAAIDGVHQIVQDFWPELTATPLPTAKPEGGK